MKKILILANHDVYVYKFRREIIEALLEKGYEVYLSCPDGKRKVDLIEMGCKFIEVSYDRHGTNIFDELKLMRYYKKLLKNIEPHVVLSYTIKPNLYGSMAAARLKIPFVANITGLGSAVENPGLLRQITKVLYKYAFRKIKCVFFQNTENMQFFVNNKLALGKHKLIPGSGVNLNHYSVLEYPSDETVEFVFISRIMKEKGIDQYLETAEFIRKKYGNTRFHICGFCEEAYEERLEQLQKDGIITYHGMVSDVREILKITHCTVHPTYYPEGMSNVLLESSASGRPVITTARSGCREIVDENVNGYIVPEKNSKELINAVERFISLPSEEKRLMGLAGRRKVEKEFSREIVVEAYIKEVETI